MTGAEEAHTRLLGLSDRELKMLCGEATHQHFKGGLYRLLGPVKDSVTGDRLRYRNPSAPIVIYEHLYPHTRELWARSEEEWNSEVVWADGVTRPRFRRLG